jgi:DNA-binding transcriptional LysR family regulator
LLAEERRGPEFNQFVTELCRSVGFVPTVYHGTVESIRAAADLILLGRCVACAPASCRSTVPGIVWRPLVDPPSHYPWSVLWRADDRSEHVRAVVTGARRLSQEYGWLQQPGQAAG